LGLPLAERKTNPPPLTRLGFRMCNTKKTVDPFTYSLASVSILQSSRLYAPALSPFIQSYLSSFNTNYITFRTVEIGKPYLFKEKNYEKK
jgi:hypothetical protein